MRALIGGLEMIVKVFLNLIKLISSKEYGVGDTIPNHSLSKLDSLDVYKSKMIINILNEIPGAKASIKKVELAYEKSK